MSIFGQMKQAMQLRNDAKRMQAEIEKINVEYSNGGITATARGDFTISSIKISPEAWAEAAGGKPERFETMLFNVINGALKNARKTVQEQMAAAVKNGEMASLFGN